MHGGDGGAVLGCVLGALLVLQGCGGDDEGNDDGGTYSSGLPEDAVLADLSAEQARGACQGFAEALDEAIGAQERARASCTGEVLGEHVSPGEDGELELDVAACENSVEQCVAQAEDEQQEERDEEDVDCDGEQVTRDLADCEVTVAEFERCINAVTASLRGFVETTNCSALGEPGALVAFAERFEQAEGFDPFDVPECTDHAGRCPSLDLLNGGDDP